MKKLRVLTIGALSAMLLLSGCASMNQTQKGAAYGAGGGAAVGAGIGAIAGGGKGAAIGAAVGTAVGAGTGALIGKRMDKQKAELEREMAQANSNVAIETVTDDNDLQAIKITFPDGILFATGKSDLSPSAIGELAVFANSLKQHPDTDITINGHTDNTGSRAINEKLSLERAQVVQNYLVGQGLNRSRFTTNGLAYDVPVADNSTLDGRAKNRRVEIFLTANEKMIHDAEQGNLR